MSEQQFMTFSELEKFFETNGNLYQNPHGIELQLTDSFSASLRLWNKEPVKFNLYAEIGEEDPELSDKLNLRSDADLDRIDEAELWQHYAAGNGYLWADLDELLDTPLEFSISVGKTMITSYNDNYSDQVDIQRIYEAVEEC